VTSASGYKARARQKARLASSDTYLDSVTAVLAAKRNGALQRTIVALWDEGALYAPRNVDSCLTTTNQEITTNV
jgi:hypothetical protein